MAELDLERYVPVHERIKQFRAELGVAGRIVTVMNYPDGNTVRCSAHVYVHSEGGWFLSSTGHAEQIRGDDTDNGFPVETCETSAVGRALAIQGYEIDRGLASRTEMEKVALKKNATGSQKPHSADMKPVAQVLEPTDEKIGEGARAQLKKLIEDLAAGVSQEQKDTLQGAVKLQLRSMNVPTDSQPGWLGRALAHLTPAQAVELEKFAKQEE